MLSREDLITHLKDLGLGNQRTAEGLADLLLNKEPTYFQNLQANYSAMMYLITEQQALIGGLLKELIEAGVLNSASLEKITNVYGNKEVLNPIYNDLYIRFAWYFVKIKEVLTTEEAQDPDSWAPKEKE